MTRPFRLTTLERLREDKLEELGRALAQAQQELNLRTTHRESMLTELMTSGITGAVTPDAVRAAAWHRVVLREQIAELDLQLVEVRGRVDLERARWVAARADLRAVQALHDQHRRARRAELARLEQRELDDLAGSRVGAGRLTVLSQAANTGADHDPYGGDAA